MNFLLTGKIALQTSVYEESITTQIQGSIILPKVRIFQNHFFTSSFNVTIFCRIAIWPKEHTFSKSLKIQDFIFPNHHTSESQFFVIVKIATTGSAE